MDLPSPILALIQLLVIGGSSTWTSGPGAKLAALKADLRGEEDAGQRLGRNHQHVIGQLHANELLRVAEKRE